MAHRWRRLDSHLCPARRPWHLRIPLPSLQSLILHARAWVRARPKYLACGTQGAFWPRPGVRIRWAEARVKITRMTLTIKLDRNWSSFQLANSAPPLSVTGSAIAPSARMLRNGWFLDAGLAPDCALSLPCTWRARALGFARLCANFLAGALAWLPVVADGHTASNAPDLFRPPKLSNAGPG